MSQGSLQMAAGGPVCPELGAVISGTSVQELGVALRAGDDHVHPDAHGLGRGRHHVVEAVVGLHAEGEGGVGALETHVVIIMRPNKNTGNTNTH